MNSSLFNLGKGITGVVVSLGVGAVVNNAVRATTPLTQTRIQRIGTKIGGYVLSSMVADHAVNYSFGQIDGMKEFYDRISGVAKNAGKPETVPGEVVDEEEPKAEEGK